MIALSVHSMFEGLACGLQTSLVPVLNIILAIGIHKSAAGSSLGIALVKTFPDDFKLVRILVLIFSSATPLGIILGMILATEGTIYSVIFSSLAAGTFSKGVEHFMALMSKYSWHTKKTRMKQLNLTHSNRGGFYS